MRNYFWTANKHLEDEVNSFFQTIERYNQTEFNGEISMLLLGSMSRGEASWKNIDGIDMIVSDIEVLTLLPIGFTRFNRLYQVFDEAKSKCFPNQTSSLFHIDYCVSCGGYDMSKMERKLLTYDANVFAYTVVGRDFKNTIPKVTYTNINMQDIWEVLVHRIFSVLYWGKPLKESSRLEEYRYNIAKNSLDLMIVILVNHHQLVSGFANRLEAIKKLDIDESIKKYFEFCLSIKLSTPCSCNYSVEEMEQLFLSIVEEQDLAFGCHLSNLIYNIKPIIRRNIGKIKRSVKTHHLPCSQKLHLRRMIKLFKEDKPITDKILKDNYVINGYPIL